MAGEEDSCMCLLTDGRNVELCSQEGSDAFLLQAGPFHFFTTNIKECNRIRKNSRQRAGGTLNADEKQRLTMVHFMADSLARCSSPALFAEKVPEEEIEFWLDHVMTELKEKTKDVRWQRTGILEQHDAFIINPCVSMFHHHAPAKMAFSKGFFQVLSEFVAARKPPLLPCADVAETICLLTSNAFISSIFKSNPWSPEKTFKKLESCGMLAQYIRVSTIPQAHDAFEFPPGILKFYEELTNNCPVFIKKKFKIGEPCGDVVHAILNGTDGHKKKRMPVINQLEAIASYAKILQPSESLQGHSGKPLKICRKCNKSDMSAAFQQSLMKCSRCEVVFYCSRECQRADWKAHKTQCQPTTKSDTKRRNAYQQVVMNFAQKHYIDIMEKVVEVCDETGLTKSDILLELDFVPDGSGSAPALRSPPVFTIKESRGYFEGTRPNEPDWFYKNEDDEVYNNNIKFMNAGLKDHYGRMTENHLLCFVRHPGFTSCYRLQLMVEQKAAQMFGEEALNAFRCAVHHDDFGPLSNIFPEAQVRSIRQTLGAMSSEAEIDRVRTMLTVLNAMGEDFPLRV